MIYRRLNRFWAGVTLIAMGIVAGRGLHDALPLTQDTAEQLVAAQREQGAPAPATTRLEGRVLDAETGAILGGGL